MYEAFVTIGASSPLELSLHVKKEEMMKESLEKLEQKRLGWHGMDNDQ